jgi:hypothetical protein
VEPRRLLVEPASLDLQPATDPSPPGPFHSDGAVVLDIAAISDDDVVLAPNRRRAAGSFDWEELWDT